MNPDSPATPFYQYNLALLHSTLHACHNAAAKYNYHVHYALKANVNTPIISAVSAIGFGADCVSGQEVEAALANGFPASRIVFAGVGKSDAEINTALDNDIFCFNVESLQELEVISQLASAKSKTASVAIRINPNVDAGTHHNITTGLDENKFGINSWDLDTCVHLLRTLPGLRFIGIHFHIGSQITNLDVYKGLCIRVNQFADYFIQKGFTIQVLNVGGGLGVNYHSPDNDMPDFDAYFKIFADHLNTVVGAQVHFELGRSLVAQCGALYARVLYVKYGKQKNFIILDAGMTELMRPALYQAYHKIENVSRAGEPATQIYDVVGPICESTDRFALAQAMPETYRGDLIKIYSTGAYGQVLSSNYNLRPLAATYYE